jgi:hypothetical protein
MHCFYVIKHLKKKNTVLQLPSLFFVAKNKIIAHYSSRGTPIGWKKRIEEP